MPAKRTETRPWDAAALLESDADLAAYLDAVLDEDDPVLLAAALGDVACQGDDADRPGDGPRAREPLQGAIARGEPGVRDRAQGGPGVGVTVAGFGVIERASVWFTVRAQRGTPEAFTGKALDDRRGRPRATANQESGRTPRHDLRGWKDVALNTRAPLTRGAGGHSMDLLDIPLPVLRTRIDDRPRLHRGGGPR
jgi:hypothetical protein